MASLTSVSGTTASLAKAERGSIDPIQQAFKRSSRRVEADIASTQVQLSAYGQLKAAFADVQSAAATLTAANKPQAIDATKKAAQGLTDAYNRAIKTVRDATDTRRPGSLADDDRARAAANELQHTLAANGALGDLKKIGITRATDGSLKLDGEKLDKALTTDPDRTRTTLTRTAQRLDRTATVELSDSGRIGNRLDSLVARARTLEARQTEQQEQAKAAQRTVETRATELSVALNGGIAAYLRTFQG